MPKVSVIMSVYNEPTEWLRMAIQSIFDQTFPDWEFIIVNDNPTNCDNRQLLKGYADSDSRVTIITNEQNIGLTRSLNKALKVAQGRYIARMDADDMSLPQRFEQQVKLLDSHPEILAVGSWTGQIDQNGNRLSGVVRYETDQRWVRAQFVQNSQIAHPAAMFHRIINNKLVQYDESVRYAQDYSLMVNILRYGEIANLPEVLLYYRISDSQITSGKKAEQQACAFKAQKRAFALFGFNASSQFQELFYRLTIQHDMNQPIDVAAKEFVSFFKDNKVTRYNTLALELIYGTYLTHLYYQNSGSWKRTLGCAVKHSTIAMQLLGIRLFVHLLARKIKRQK